jgi:hypothetical protein
VVPGQTGYHKDMALTSSLRCPCCQVESPAEMPEGACLYFWDCPACQATVRPKPGDCCVFCSFGPDVCPPKELELSRTQAR